LYPELLPWACHDFTDVVVCNGSTVAQIMPVYRKMITIKPVQARHRTYPHKTRAIPENTVDLVVGQALVNINPVELVGEGLPLQLC